MVVARGRTRNSPRFFHWSQPDGLPDAEGRRWSYALNLYLGVQDGVLRYFTESGALVPTPEEAAAQAQMQIEQAEARAHRLAEQLKNLGIEPEG